MSYSSEIEQLLSNAEHAAQDNNYALATRLLKKSLSVFVHECTNDFSDPRFIKLMIKLAELYECWDKTDKAEHIYTKAIQFLDQSGQEHKLLCQTLNCLAKVYLKSNKIIQALPLLDRAVLTAEEWLENTDVETIESSRNLAMVNYRLGKHARAKVLCERILRTQETLYGSWHGSLADTLELLATINQANRKFDFSESQYKRALSIKEGQFGQQNVNVARLMRKLASVHCDRHDHALAKPLLKRSLAIRKALEIPEDEELANIFQQLAEVYYVECNYRAAELYYKKALRIRQRLNGRQSLEVADSRCGLGKLYCVTKRYAEAESQLNSALEIQIDMLGPYNREVAATLSKLAGVYMSQGRFNEANLMKDQATTCQVQHMQLAVDDHDPYDRAVVYHSQGAYKEAEEFYNKALAKVERSLGMDHFHLAEILTKLAELNRSTENYDKAEMLLLQALKIFQRMQHRAILTTYAYLADLYSFQKRYDEAESLFQDAVKLLNGVSGVRLSDQVAILGGYEKLLISCGRQPEADKIHWQLKVILRRQRDYQSLTKKEIGI